ncbi:hypothetical protein AM587_10012646 [Phytophthora nicotianae]|uniref:MULE transposase domain-containing protein n=1 Tax=Phytophthora nicotianae TaxID=4792 RepID=A0A0W8C2C2_PHYNI|nr:hypothetical protein AM587_10012646 [Phytophthora nicotianae]
MGDADGAQYNAMDRFFEGCNPEILVCFYHVVAKVHERSSSIHPGKRSLVVAAIFDMYYAKTASQFHSKKTTILWQWLADPDIKEFGKYFHKQWLFGKFLKWQCFRTPIGLATTSSPVETFKAKVKCTYTLRSRMYIPSKS